MIKFSQFINEVKMQKVGSLEFFKNPSRKDLTRLIDNGKLGDIRGSALNGGDVWIWNAEKEIHDFALQKLGFSSRTERIDFIIENLSEYADEGEYLFIASFWEVDRGSKNDENSISLEAAKKQHNNLNRMLNGLTIDNDDNARKDAFGRYK